MTQASAHVQVLMPAALCVSVSVVQAGGRVVARTAQVQLPPHDPLAALRPTGPLAFFLSVCAVPHTTAGALAYACLLGTCATWPSTLNIVFCGALMWCAWQWALPAASQAMPAPQPFLGARACTALTIWAAVHLTVLYAVQMPDAARVVGAPALSWLNLGVFSEQDAIQSTVLLAAHAVSLALLYLALIALRRTHDSDTRLWPQVSDIDETAEQAAAAANDVHVQLSKGKQRVTTELDRDTRPSFDQQSAVVSASHHGTPSTFLRQHSALLSPGRGAALPQDSQQSPQGFEVEAARSAAAWLEESDDYDESPPRAGALPALVGACSHAAQTLFRPRAPVACALAIFALAMPSGLSAVLLAAAFAQLLLQPAVAGHHAGQLQQVLLAGLAAWFMLSYFCLATQVGPALPRVLQAGLLVTSKQLLALEPLLVTYEVALFWLVIVAAAAHTRAQRVPTLWARLLTNAGVRRIAGPGALRQRLTASRQPAPPGTQEESRQSSQEDAVPSASQCDARGSVRVSAALPVLFAAHVLGTALVPFGWLSLSLLHMCAAGCAYAVLPALQWALPMRRKCMLLPRPGRQLLLRSYAALHVLLGLCVFVAQPAEPKIIVLLLVGESEVSLQRHLAPILAMFLLTTAHAALGDYLQAATGGLHAAVQCNGEDDGDAVSVPLLGRQGSGSQHAGSRHARYLQKKWQPPLRCAAAINKHAGVHLRAMLLPAWTRNASSFKTVTGKFFFSCLQH